jgi:hypothetical protein
MRSINNEVVLSAITSAFVCRSALVQTPLSAKAANDQVLITEYNVNSKKLEVRRNVLLAVEHLKEKFRSLNFANVFRKITFYVPKYRRNSRQGDNSEAYRTSSRAYYTRRRRSFRPVRF